MIEAKEELEATILSRRVVWDGFQASGKPWSFFRSLEIHTTFKDLSRTSTFGARKPLFA